MIRAIESSAPSAVASQESTRPVEEEQRRAEAQRAAEQEDAALAQISRENQRAAEEVPKESAEPQPQESSSIDIEA